MINKSEFWSSVHFDHNTALERLSYTNESFDSEIGWLQYLISKTPNGFLLRKNSLCNIPQNGKIYLAHTTNDFELIKRSGKLLSSSGCLLASLYCTPVIREKNKLRLHNLGEYIFLKESRIFGEKNKKSALLLIELEFPHSEINNSVGINYLKLGIIHFSIFSELSYLLSQKELTELKIKTVKLIKKTKDLFSIIEDFSFESIKQNFKKFYKLYCQATDELPILGYLLFEILCEYIALFQEGKKAERYHQFNEIYCGNFKNLIFSVCPSLTKSFNLGLFNPDIASVINYLKKIKIIKTENDLSCFEEYLIRRLSYMVKNYFYNQNSTSDLRKLFWQSIEWNFDYLQNQLTPLIGHTIHRLLRNMHRYPNFYFYFDQYKALQVWNYWNQISVALPYNAILPKGEVGINPAYPDMRYKIFTTEFYRENGYSYVSPKEKIPLIIEPRLVEINMLCMRKK